MITTDALTVCDMVRGTLANTRHGNTRVKGVSIDTRSLKKGSAFFCLKGANSDGHDFAMQAVEAGASVIVADRQHATSWAACTAPVIAVDDPLTALGQLAAEYRKQFKTRYVAITGSVGKTTTKELIAAALSAKCRVYKSPGNFNNLIGIPLALLAMPPARAQESNLGVLEFGMSSVGEIRRLVEIVDPAWGVVTRIGAAHLLQLGSLDAVAAAKRELFDYARPEMTAILNADDPFQRQWLASWNRDTVTYGLDALLKPTFWADQIVTTATGVGFRVNGRHAFRLALAGEYNVPNALAAIAIGRHLGVPFGSIAQKLTRVRPVGERSRLIRQAGVTLISDCYNANPTSMLAAIDGLKRFPRAGRRIAVLGAMRELGPEEKKLHREVGHAADGLDLVITVGSDATAYRNGTADSSLEWINARDGGEGAKLLLSLLRPGDVVLFKASHAEHLEDAVAEVAERLAGATAKRSGRSVVKTRKA
jgi:UDP-N-acetylmuramoyl-tripeptide--D-alanyl-D-alanine ligase